jgi:peptidoglycan/xylan/chitin deacetylase (PgdA/CDA1 family)
MTLAAVSTSRLAAGEVVEEEQRLGALHQDVVHAHRHQVLAHRVVAVQLEGQLQLGADAVGAGDQHRLPVFLRDLEEGAEAADAGHHLGAQGASGERLDAFDEGIAGIDVDAGIAIGKWGGQGDIRFVIKLRFAQEQADFIVCPAGATKPSNNPSCPSS